MTSFPSDDIEAVLLYDRPFPRLEPQRLFAALMRRLHPRGIEVVPVQSGDCWGLVRIGPFYVLATQADRPLAPAGFAGALRSCYNTLVFPALREVVDAHSCHVFITVSSQIPAYGRMMQTMAPALGLSLPEPETADSLDLKLTLCRMVTSLFFQNACPTAVRWCSSGLVLPPDQFAATMNDATPFRLQVHPHVFSSRARVRDQLVIGLRTDGARFLTGWEFTLDEAPVPLAEQIALMHAFIAHVQTLPRGMVSDGEMFGQDRRERVRVRWCPFEDGQPPHARLSWDRSARWRIRPGGRTGSLFDAMRQHLRPA